MIDKFLEIKTIDPEYWGKSGWIFLNSIALTYKPQYKNNYKQFISELPWILPCETCGLNLKKNMNSIDEALESKENLLRWLLKIRNDIYIDNRTPWKQKNINETFNEIFNNHNSNNKYYLWIIFLILILILLIYIFKMK